MQTYVTHFGLMTTNRKQQKKHVSQLSTQELALIAKQLITKTFTQPLTISRHLQTKIDFEEVDLIEPMLDSIIDNPMASLIEYSRLRNENRVLLRSSLTYPMMLDTKLCNTALCIVIDINTSEIVTAYYNHANDNHQHLHLDKYDKNLTVIVA